MRADQWSDERIDLLKMALGGGQNRERDRQAAWQPSRSAVSRKNLSAAACTAPYRQIAHRGSKGNGSKAKAKAGPPKTQQTVRKNDGVAALKSELAAKTSRASTRKSLFQLTNHCCRWPHGRPGTKNFFFCGAGGADVENGQPYCAEHMRRAYVVVPANTITPWRVVSRAA